MSRILTLQEQVTEYVDRGLSLIPLVPRGKTPLDAALPRVHGRPSWKGYQTQAAPADDVLQWFADYGADMGGTGLNIGLVTGYKGLYVLDIDGPVIPPSLAACHTTTVRTGREGGGYHLYFTGPGHLPSAVLTIDGTRCEFKGVGSYAVAPVSVHASGTSYMFERSLDVIKALPGDILRGLLTMSETPRGAGIEARGRACLQQIWDRALVEGERDLALYALYQGLITARHEEVYARGRLYRKNETLAHPLTDAEIRAIVQHGPEGDRPGHRYGVGCQWTRRNLPWIDCQRCKYADKETTRMINAYEFDKAYDDKDLNGAAFKVFIALIREEQQTGQRTLSVRKAEELTGYSHRAIQEAFRVLKAKGYL